LQILFFDTCALLNTPFKKYLEAEDVKGVISDITLRELEGIKTSGYKDETTKYNARKVVDYINKEDSKIEVINYKRTYNWTLFSKNLPIINDNQIIVNCWKYIKKNHIKDYVFLTTDKSCLNTSKRVFKMKAQLSLEQEEDEYTGFRTIICNEEELNSFYSYLLQDNKNEYELLENQYLIIQDEFGKIVDKYRWRDNQYIKVPFIKFDSAMFGKVGPKDPYQQLAFDCLSENQIVMLRGAAGSGKSYIAFSYMFSLLEKGHIDKIIVFCNTVATKGAAKLGFYPGDKDEKLLDSQIGNLFNSKLGDKAYVEKLIDDGRLVLLPMSDIRGYDTTGMDAAVYIPEAQNLDIELMRLALQRIGDDSLCILDGDSSAQVDLDMYAGERNGMRRVSKVFRGAPFYGEVTLQQIHRSKIAELAQKL